MELLFSKSKINRARPMKFKIKLLISICIFFMFVWISPMQTLLNTIESFDAVKVLKQLPQYMELRNQSVILDQGYKQTIYGCSAQGQPIYSELICDKNLGTLHHIWTLDSSQNVIYKVVGTDLQGQRFESIGYTLSGPEFTISQSSVYEIAQQATESVVEYSRQVGATEYLDIPVFRIFHEQYPTLTMKAEEIQVLSHDGALQTISRPHSKVDSLLDKFKVSKFSIPRGIAENLKIEVGNQSFGNPSAQFGVSVGFGQPQDVELVNQHQRDLAMREYEKLPEVQACIHETQEFIVTLVNDADTNEQRVHIANIYKQVDKLNEFKASPHCTYLKDILSAQQAIFYDKDGTITITKDRNQRALYLVYDYFKKVYKGPDGAKDMFQKLAQQGHKGIQTFLERENSGWAPWIKVRDWVTHVPDQYFHRDRVAEVKSSEFLQAQRRIVLLCKQQKFKEANDIQRKWAFRDDKKGGLLKSDIDYWHNLAKNVYGIRDEYSIDPYYHRVMSSALQEELRDPAFIQDLNKVLAQRQNKVAEFLSDLGYENVSVPTYQIACNVLDLQGSPDELVSYLSQLSSNYPNQVVQEAYHVFFNESGVLKFNEASGRLLGDRTLPRKIGDISATKERELLNKLLITPIIYPADSIELQAGINAVIAACEHPELKTAYHEFVENIFQRNGIPDEQRETFFVPFVDFSRSAEDVNLQVNIVQGMADTFHQLRTAADDEKAGLQKVLKGFHNAFVASQAGDMKRAELLMVGARSGLFDEVHSGFDAELMSLDDQKSFGKDIILNDGAVFSLDADESLYSLIEASDLARPSLIYSGRRLSPHEVSAPPFAVVEQQLRKEGGIYADLADALSSFETWRQSIDESSVERAIVAAYDKLGISHDFLLDGQIKEDSQLHDSFVEVKDIFDYRFKVDTARRHGAIARILSQLTTGVVHADRYVADVVSGLEDASLLFYDVFFAQYMPKAYREKAIERSFDRIEAFSNFVKSLENMDVNQRERLKAKLITNFLSSKVFTTLKAATASVAKQYVPKIDFLKKFGIKEVEFVTPDGSRIKAPVPKDSGVEFAKHQQNTPKGGGLKTSKPLEATFSKKRIPGDGYDPKWRYENAPYHTRKSNPIKSKAPIDGEDALQRSIQINPDSSRRIAISNGEFVVLSETLPGLYHGHVRTWEQLGEDMQNILTNSGLVRNKGKII